MSPDLGLFRQRMSCAVPGTSVLMALTQHRGPRGALPVLTTRPVLCFPSCPRSRCLLRWIPRPSSLLFFLTIPLSPPWLPPQGRTYGQTFPCCCHQHIHSVVHSSWVLAASPGLALGTLWAIGGSAFPTHHTDVPTFPFLSRCHSVSY